MIKKWFKNRVAQGEKLKFKNLKILLVKLKNLYTSACLKLNYCTAKHKPKL